MTIACTAIISTNTATFAQSPSNKPDKWRCFGAEWGVIATLIRENYCGVSVGVDDSKVSAEMSKTCGANVRDEYFAALSLARKGEYQTLGFSKMDIEQLFKAAEKELGASKCDPYTDPNWVEPKKPESIPPTIEIPY